MRGKVERVTTYQLHVFKCCLNSSHCLRFFVSYYFVTYAWCFAVLCTRMVTVSQLIASLFKLMCFFTFV